MQIRTGAAVINRHGSAGALTNDRRAACLPTAAVYPWSGGAAVDIEVLVGWALGPQRAGSVRGAGLLPAEAAAAGFPMARVSPDGCAAIERWSLLEQRVDVSSVGGRDVVHAVAEAVADAVALSDERLLIAHHGRLGTRPGGWAWPERVFVPELGWKEYGVDAQWAYSDRRSSPCCPVIAVTDGEQIAAARAAYQRWRDALETLAWTLSGRALGFVVRAPGVVRAPWERVRAQMPLDAAALV